MQLARQEVEAWRDASAGTMERADLESFVAFGLDILQFIRRVDRQWCADVAAGQAPNDPSTMRHIGEMYALWLAPADSLGRELCRLSGDRAPLATRMREAIAEVRAILSLDAERLNKPVSSTSSIEAVRARIQNRI